MSVEVVRGSGPDIRSGVVVMVRVIEWTASLHDVTALVCSTNFAFTVICYE